jgi:glyoxylase-like metal-dependent hydrolase (beta-lactamase superfamily II)
MPPSLSVIDYVLLDTGYCLASEHHLLAGGTRRTIACHALAALLRHPDHGWLLWDTGYAPRMWDVTRGLPFRLYRYVTPLHIAPRLAVVNQVARFGLRPDDIRTVIISHFHADHIGGMMDFPRAEFVAHQAAYLDIADRRGWRALRKAFIPALLPTDFTTRLRAVADFTGPELPALGPTHDLLGDGSLLLVALPGHARGQIGMLARTARGPVLLAADGAWLTRAIRENRPPAAITHFLADDPAAMQAILARLHDFAQARPDVRLIPTHCPEVFYEDIVLGQAPQPGPGRPA